ncbi:MAG: LysM peptidoglycan-binding domain-containing protein, partial [Bacilli bacterium]|nr:LysM peptidoglycan-binding domain-containing protein [Bacilli bacterium]
MKIIIDPYRGGQDTGINLNGKYEKNILLEISNYMADRFRQNGIDTELLRNSDISLTDDERNSIINEIKNDNDIIIQNRFTEDNEFNIIYPLRSTDYLPSLISNNLEKNNITVNKYFQRRLPTNTLLDYYNVIRNTKPNETIIIEYLPNSNYQNIINIIVDTISSYINKKNTYTVKKGDNLYQIANKYNVSVDEIKKLNNLTTNNLSINQVLKIPEKKDISNDGISPNTYTVKKGDTLYQIANKYNVSVEEIKKLNSLTTNNLSINQVLKIPGNN